MVRATRRRFLQTSAFAGATFVISGTKSSGQVVGANEAIRLCVAGLNGRGGAHVGEFAGMQGVRITHLVDPDQKTWESKQKQVEVKAGNKPEALADIRRVLDDKNVDAVSIATPNHWHSLMTIWACQAGKDVYVEKPCSHNIHEGRIAVEMARKHNRIVQHGTQNRSSSGWAQVAEQVKSGQLGKLLVSRGLCYKNRGSIGQKPAGDPPANLDFNLWLGPAAKQPYHGNLVHYNWHWFWDFGNGDIGNQGVHQMDIARWVMGVTLPKSVFSVGGRFGYKDQGETANTQISVMDFGEGRQLMFEVRGLKTTGYRGQGVGNTVHLEAGVFEGTTFKPADSAKTVTLPKVDAKRGPGGGHFGNFIAAVRSRKQADLNADILDGHYSSALCHLANLSYRLGQAGSFSEKSKLFAGNAAGLEAFERMEEHLGANGLKLNEERLQVGRLLHFDPATERFVNDAEANALLTRPAREGFAVPEKVA